MSVSFVLEALVVLGGHRHGHPGRRRRRRVCGVASARSCWSSSSARRPGEPPAAAVAIILARGHGRRDDAGRRGHRLDGGHGRAGDREAHPKQITVIAPLTAFLFCVGSGTGNIIYPLLPVIYDVSYKNHIRPARPLTVTVVQSGMALAASPVSAAMAAMLTLTDVAPYNLGLTQILAITLPACVIGIVVTALVVNRMWKDLDDDPEVQAKIASGELAAPSPAGCGSRRRLLRQRGRPTPRPCPRPGRLPRPSRHPTPPRSRTPRRAATRRWSSCSASSPSWSSASSPTCGPSFEVEGEVGVDRHDDHHRPGHVRRRRHHPVPRPPRREDRARPVGVQGRHDLGHRAVRDRLADRHVHRRPRGLHHRAPSVPGSRTGSSSSPSPSSSSRR